MLPRAPFQARLPYQRWQVVRGAVFVNLLEQLLRELSFFCCPLRIGASCRYGGTLTQCNTWYSRTCREQH